MTQRIGYVTDNQGMTWICLAALLITASEPERTETIGFVGFSRNDAVAAWRVTTRLIYPEYVDSYALVRVAEVDSGRMLGTYRWSPITRRSRNGQTLRLADDERAALYPEWQQAEQRGAWEKLHRQNRWRSTRLPMNEGTVRIAVVGYTQAMVTATSDALTVRVPAGEPADFDTVARLEDGTSSGLGRLTTSAGEHELSTDVVVYASTDGRAAAVVHAIREAVQVRSLLALARLPDPIASGRIGAGHLNQYERSFRRIFVAVHPELRQIYDAFTPRP
jgi:hypothetical protein